MYIWATSPDGLATIGSFFAGIAFTWAWWWYLAHYVVPSIKFSVEIARYQLPDGDWIWLCEIENCGKRNIIDVEIVCRIAITGFKGTEDTAYHTIVTNASYVPRLGYGRSRKVRIFDTREQLEFKDKPSLPLRTAILACGTLDEILDLGTSASAAIYVSGYDETSGARRVMRSHDYTKSSIRKGTLRKMNVVQQTSEWLEAGKL